MKRAWRWLTSPASPAVLSIGLYVGLAAGEVLAHYLARRAAGASALGYDEPGPAAEDPAS